MNIKALVDKYAPANVTADMAYPEAEGFRLTLAFMTENQLQKAVERSKKVKWERHQRRDVTDDAAFRAELAGHVHAWEGLTPSVLAALGLVKLSDVPEGERAEPIPCTPANVADLMGECPSFGAWVLDTITNPDAFPLAADKENLSGGPGGGQNPAD